LKLADDAAQIATAIGTTSSMDSSRVQVRSLKRNASAALDLLADVALHPSFPAEEIERQRGQRLTQLVERRGDPVRSPTPPWRRRCMDPGTPTGSPNSARRPA
jgi:zinc protease